MTMPTEGLKPRIMMQATGVRKSFGMLEVLKGIDLSVLHGEVVCLLGQSGSGKSTFLRCINHLERIDFGRIRVDGELIGYTERSGHLREMHEHEIARQRVHIGMVFQHFNLFPHMTVLQNVIEGPIGVKGEKRSEIVEQAQAILKRVGLSEKVNAYPRQLSGGQQQRVAIARALITDPTLIVADEPTGDLDTKSADAILTLMEVVRSQLNKTIIMVTHDPKAAARAQRTLHLEKGRLVLDTALAAV